MKSDIEIAHSIELQPIEEVAARYDIPVGEIEHYGHYIAKVPLHLIDNEQSRKSHLILVTAITPTKAGIGKTTVSVGLALGLNALGRKAICALREPSLGPCFGMKGGAAGGGYAQVLPMEKINLHFTGDFHAITSAHNMITALLDNYIHQHQVEGFAMKEVLWNRVLDVNDRTLRQIVTGLGGATNGVTRESGFDITPASELMAILCLSSDEHDLRRRIENILLGYTMDDKPFTVKDLGVAGAIAVLLRDAIAPNLVQTTEHTASFIHGGPFANIAHGCNSIIATRMAMSYGEYAITEAGFGADLGAEKFFNVKCRKAGLQPSLTVLVVTVQSLKLHAGINAELLSAHDTRAVEQGLCNLDKHIANMQSFGQTVVVALNRYATDADDEIDIVINHCKQLGIGIAINDAFAKGGEGAKALAQLVVDTIEQKPSQPLILTYADEDTVEQKVSKVATQLYGAAFVSYTAAARKKLKQIQQLGYGHFPICIAKTQYSFSTDPKKVGVPKGFELQVRDIVINAGAEMLVIIAGNIMRMPGLPKSPQALRIDITPDGQITGLS